MCIPTETQGCLSGQIASPLWLGVGRSRLLPGPSHELGEVIPWPLAPLGPWPAASCAPPPSALAAMKIISSEKWKLSCWALLGMGAHGTQMSDGSCFFSTVSRAAFPGRLRLHVYPGDDGQRRQHLPSQKNHPSMRLTAVFSCPSPGSSEDGVEVKLRRLPGRSGKAAPHGAGGGLSRWVLRKTVPNFRNADPHL